MRALLLDTSVLIDHLRGVEGAVSLCTQAAKQGAMLWSATPVRTEILAGMRPEEERATRTLLDVLEWQNVTVEIADKAGALAADFMRSHPGVDTVDYLIAATALHLNAELRTMNVKHFAMFPELEAPYSY